MALEWLACERCREVTPHRSITVQLYGPGERHRFEKAFLLCTGCLKAGGDALTHVVEDYYFHTAGARPNDAPEAMIMAAIVSTEGETFGKITRKMRTAPKSLAAESTTEPELERILDGMARGELIYRRRVDRTEIVTRKLLEGRQKPSSPCCECGSARVVGLYAAFKKTASQSKVRVGSYCLMCNVHFLDRAKLLGKAADR